MNLPKRRLYQAIKEKFNKDEIRALCFSLGINHEELDEKTISTLTESLLLYTERHGRITDLLHLLEADRPLINWSELAFANVECPYRGLLPFREEHAHLFFGRDAYIDRLLEAIAKQPLVAVIGPSGSGKSSVIFAGLVPKLRQTSEWQIVGFRPSKAPFTALAGAFMPLLEPELTKTEQLREVNKLSADLSLGKTSLTRVIDLFAKSMGRDRQLLLIIDQFEELFTLTKDAAKQQQFLQALLDLHNTEYVTMLLAMRADFLGRALLFRPFADELQVASQLIGPMSRDELIEVIECPLAGAFVTFETGLTTQILDDVGQEPGNLPLLEFALTSLWEQQVDGKLTYSAYEEIGKVEGALTAHAEECYSAFKRVEEAEQVRKFFLQMVQPVTGSLNVKRTAKRNDLGDALWQLSTQLADARLVVTSFDESGEETIELAHEALMTNWQRFEAWIQADWEFRAWQERLRTDLRQWQSYDKQENFLLLGAPLAVAEDWLVQRRSDLREPEVLFIEFSLQAEQRRQAEEEARRQRELKQVQALANTEKRRAEEQTRAAKKLRNRAYLLVGALGFAILLAFIALLSYQDSQGSERFALAESTRAFNSEATAISSGATAVSERSFAIAAAATSDYNEGLAEQRAVEARENAEIAQTRQADLIVILTELEREVNYSRVRELASEADIALIDYPQRSVLLALESVRLTSLSNESSLVIAENALRQALANIGGIGSLPDGSYNYSGLAEFSPDSKWYAVVQNDYSNAHFVVSLIPLDNESLSPIDLSGPTSAINDIQFSPQGNWLAVLSDDKTIHLWNVDAPDRAPRILEGWEEKLKVLGFSHDGTWLGSGGEGGLYLWLMDSLNDPNSEPIHLTVQEGTILTLDFSHNGKWIAAGGGDPYSWPSYGITALWNLADLSAGPIILEGHLGEDDTIKSVVFSPDDQWLATSVGTFGKGNTENATVHLWPMKTPGRSPIVLDDHNGSINSMYFNNNGRWLITASFDQTVRIWDIDNIDRVSSATFVFEKGVYVNQAKISPDDQWVTSSGDGNQVYLWDFEELAENPGISPVVLKGHESFIADVDFSPDNRWLATGDFNGGIRLWPIDRITDRPTAYTEGFQVPVSGGLQLSRHGQWLTNQQGQALSLWRTSDIMHNRKNEPIVVRHAGSYIRAFAFDFDETMLAVITSESYNDEDYSLFLWDLSGIPYYRELNLPEQVGTRIQNGSLAMSDEWLLVLDFQTAFLWDMVALKNRGENLRPVELCCHQTTIYEAEFSSNAGFLLTRGGYHLYLWDLIKQNEPVSILAPERISTFEISPNVEWIAIGGEKSIFLKKTDDITGETITLRGHDESVTHLAFNENSTKLISYSRDGRVLLWNLENPNIDPVIIYQGDDSFLDIGYGPGEEMIYALERVGSINKLVVWSLDLGELIIKACLAVGRNFTPTEWNRYFPNDTYHETCEN